MKEFDFIEFWALEFKKNPEKNRKILYEFIDSQIKIANDRLKKLSAEQLIEIFDIKNEEIIKKLKKRDLERKNLEMKRLP